MAASFAGRRAAAHRAREFRPALRVEPLQRAVVGFERMAGQEEADRVEFARAAARPRSRAARGILSGCGVGVAEQPALARARAPRACAARAPSIGSTAAKAAARSGSRSSNAPALARHSSAFLLTRRGSMRRAKSPSDANGRSPRASTSARACAVADALDRAQRVDDRGAPDGVVAHVEIDVGFVDRGRLAP